MNSVQKFQYIDTLHALKCTTLAALRLARVAYWILCGNVLLVWLISVNGDYDLHKWGLAQSPSCERPCTTLSTRAH